MSRRFIAGAVCPSCGEMDALFMSVGEARDKVQCALCDYADERPELDERGPGVGDPLSSTEPPGVFWRSQD